MEEKKGRGRPWKNHESPRDVNLCLRCSKEEREEIRDAAHLTGRTMTDYIIYLVRKDMDDESENGYVW